MQLANLFPRIAVIAGETLVQSKNQVAALFAAALVISGCVSSPAPTHNTSGAPHLPYRLLASDMEAVKLGVAADMKDPNSAIFGAMAATVNAKNIVTVCGVVNGRNSYGGFTGKKPYWGVLATNMAGERKFTVTGFGGTAIQSQAVMDMCKRDGLG